MKRLLTISAEMKSSRPVFIVGEARSGTSILYRTLLKLSSFRTLDTNLAETEIFSHLRRTFMFGVSYPQSLLRFMLNDSVAYRHFLASIRVIRLVNVLAIGPNLVFRDRSDFIWYANLNHLLLRSYFFHAAKARGCRRLIEKTPTNTANLSRLWRSFPSAQFLYVYRHPVDVFSSYRRRAKDDPAAVWAKELTPEDFCKAYSASAGRVLRWTHDHENLRMIRYEDFTRDPSGQLRDICEFLEEPYEAEAVQEPRPDLNRWRGDPHLWGEIVPVTKNWRDYVSAEEAHVIQTALSQVMKRLEYEPYVLTPSAPPG